MNSINDNNFDQNYFEDTYFEKRVWIASAKTANQLYIFTRLYIGENDEMGKKTFSDLLTAISESETIPKTMAFWNNAVKACVEGSPLLEIITQIEKLGVKILVAGHALNKLNLKSSLRTGKTANHFDLIEAINQSNKVLNF
ncbi:MAG: hypothetical protein PHF08_06800 [Candidatus Riflebacteria bacterium]|nr:hypothetical protein [Candidatus Riflebacteria bacterium]MDD3377145.1 hypothetical protein [Candidatus Riflebacteria bacterium]NLV93948.1 hypothetical protein [Candidatus Riflebacteria bacterium]